MRRTVVVGYDLWSRGVVVSSPRATYVSPHIPAVLLSLLSQGEATCRIPYHSMSFRLRESKEPAVVMPGMWCPAY
jgi:hypothetical protein